MPPCSGERWEVEVGGEVRVPVYCKLYPCLVPPKPTGVTSIVITRKGGRGRGEATQHNRNRTESR